MYAIFAHIYHKNQPNVGTYTIHGSYGLSWNLLTPFAFVWHVRNLRWIEADTLGRFLAPLLVFLSTKGVKTCHKPSSWWCLMCKTTKHQVSYSLLQLGERFLAGSRCSHQLPNWIFDFGAFWWTKQNPQDNSPFKWIWFDFKCANMHSRSLWQDVFPSWYNRNAVKGLPLTHPSFCKKGFKWRKNRFFQL